MITLNRICFACPEAYDAYRDGELVGYLRLRHGRFTVQCPDLADHMVYSAFPKGDGIFDADERDYHLRWAVHKIEEFLQHGPQTPPAPDVQYEVTGVDLSDEDLI